MIPEKAVKKIYYNLNSYECFRFLSCRCRANSLEKQSPAHFSPRSRIQQSGELMSKMQKKWSSRQKKSTQYKYIQIKTHYLTSVTVAVECVLSVYFVNKSCYGHRQAHTHYNLFALSKLAQHKTKIIFNADFFLHLLHSVIFWFCIQLFFSFFYFYSTSHLSPTEVLVSRVDFPHATLLYCRYFLLHVYFWSSEVHTEFHLGNQPVEDWRLLDVYISPNCFCHSHEQANKQTNEQSQKNTVDV